MEIRAKDDGSVFYLLGKRFEKKHKSSMAQNELIEALRKENPSLRGKSDEEISRLIEDHA